MASFHVTYRLASIFSQLTTKGIPDTKAYIYLEIQLLKNCGCYLEDTMFEHFEKPVTMNRWQSTAQYFHCVAMLTRYTWLLIERTLFFVYTCSVFSDFLVQFFEYSPGFITVAKTNCSKEMNK